MMGIQIYPMGVKKELVVLLKINHENAGFPPEA
jgi:hypothetical protein